MTPKAARPAPNVSVGERVKARRLELGWSQHELAARARVHATYISMLEAGRLNPGVNKVVDIAYALGVTPGRLMGDLIPRDLRGRRRPPDTDAPA
jgi:transcriptional regulator with XRE-family HTH domain